MQTIKDILKLIIVMLTVITLYGLGLFGCITFILVIMKCLGFFHHSWITVFLPLACDILILSFCFLGTILIVNEECNFKDFL